MNSAGAPGLFRVDADTVPSGSEDATPGSRACVRVRAPLGLFGRAGLPRAFWCASPFPVAGLGALFVFPAPSGLGWRFFFFFVLSFCAPPSSLAFRAFWPGTLWASASCCPTPPPFVFVVFFCHLPPPLVFFSSWPAFPLSFFFLLPLPFSFFPPLCAPRLSLAVRVFRPGLPWALASCCPPAPDPFLFSFFSLLFFPACFSFVSCFFSLSPALPPFLFCFFPRMCLPVKRCGGGLCVWDRGVCWCVLGGAVPAVALCAVLSSPSGAGWCCVSLPVVFGCLLLGLAVLFCLPPGLGVVFRWCCPCLASWLAALWFGVVCLGARLPCVVFCGAVLSCSAVCFRRRLCLLFVLCRCASAVCDLGCLAVRFLSSPPCTVLYCAVLVPLRYALRVVCIVSGAWCCWFLVSLPVFRSPLVALVAWHCRLVVCVGSGVRIGPRRPSLCVLVCFPVVSCSPVLCPVVLWCRVVLCCGALLSFFFALLVVLVFCFPLKICRKTRKNGFPFLKIN